MRFVVTGTCGVISRSTSRSARKQSRICSELKRRQSSSSEGFCIEGVGSGAWMSASSPITWPQNAVPHAVFTASSEPWRSSAQARNASCAAGEKLSPTGAPYSLWTCQPRSPGWSP